MRVGGASREGSQGIRVPPRPGAAGWVTGSACAGLFLGLAELLVTAPVVWLPTPLALALIASCTALVMACAGAWTLVTRLPGTSLTRSAQGGAMLGPLFAVGGSGPLRLALLGREEPWSWLVAGLVGATLLVGVGLAGAFVTTRSERTRPASPALTWAGASLLLAGLGRTLHEDAGGLWNSNREP